ncbi:hypothetical protein H8958_006580, partial [Nasalis larvatus]
MWFGGNQWNHFGVNGMPELISRDPPAPTPEYPCGGWHCVEQGLYAARSTGGPHLPTPPSCCSFTLTLQLSPVHSSLPSFPPLLPLG